MKIAVYAKSVRDPKHQAGFGELLMALSQRGHEIWLPPSLEDHVHMNIASGTPKLIALGKLMDGFIKDDKIFLECRITEGTRALPQKKVLLK